MPRIQRASVPDVQAAAYQGAAPADKTAQYRGQAALAEGLADAGDAMTRFALRSQAIRNEAALTKGRLAMQQTEADLQSAFEKNPDPEQWERLTQESTEKAYGAVFASEGATAMAPEVKRALDAEFRQWAQRTTSTVRNQAQRKRNDEADALLVEEQATLVASGNLDGALAQVDKRESLGLISPDRAKLERTAVAHDVDVQTLNRDIADDPFTAVDKLESRTDKGSPRFYKTLSEKDRLAALRSAKNAMETARAETVRDLQEYILDRGGIGAEAKINNWLEARRILPSQAAQLKKFAAGQRTPDDMAAEGSRLWQAAIDIDRADPDYIQKVMKIRAAAHTLDPTVRDPILDTLQQKDRNDVREDTQRVYDLLNRDYRANVFGSIQTYTQAEIDDSKALRKAGKREGDPKDPAAYERASATLFRYQRALREFISKNPDATPEDVMNERARITAQDRQAVLGTLAVDALSGAVQ